MQNNVKKRKIIYRALFCICLLFVVQAFICEEAAIFEISKGLAQSIDIPANEFIQVDKERIDKIFSENEIEKTEKAAINFAKLKQVASSFNKNIATLNQNNTINFYNGIDHKFSMKINSSGFVDIVFLNDNELMIVNYRLQIIYVVDIDGNVKEAYLVPKNFYPEDYRIVDKETFEVSKNFFGHKIYLKENGERMGLVESGGYLSGIGELIKYPLLIGINVLLGYICIKNRKKFYAFFFKRQNK